MLILIFLIIATDWWPGCSPTQWRSARWSARTRRRGRRTNPSRSISLEQTLLRWDSRKSLVIQDLGKVCFNSNKETPPPFVDCLFVFDETLSCFPSPWPTSPESSGTSFPRTIYFRLCVKYSEFPSHLSLHLDVAFYSKCFVRRPNHSPKTIYQTAFDFQIYLAFFFCLVTFFTQNFLLQWILTNSILPKPIIEWFARLVSCHLVVFKCYRCNISPLSVFRLAPSLSDFPNPVPTFSFIDWISLFRCVTGVWYFPIRTLF